MTSTTTNKIRIAVYVSPETFRAIDDAKNPSVSRSKYCSMVLDELFGIVG